MPEKRLGLDIREQGVAAVLVRGGLKTNQILAHAWIPVNGDLGIATALEQALASVTAQAGIERCPVAASFSDEDFSFRFVEVPFSEQRKIRQILPFELETLLPYRAEDIVSDYLVVEKGQTTKCLAVALPSSAVAKNLELLGQNSINAESLCISAANAALLLASDPGIPKNAFFVDADSKRACILLLHEGRLVFLRHVAGPFDEQMAQLAEQMSFSARAYSQGFGGEFSPSTVFVSGPAFAEQNAAKELAGWSGLEVVSTDLAQQTQTRSLPESQEPWQPALLNGALSLALVEPSPNQGFNLRQGPFAVTKRWEKHRDSLIHAGVLLGILVFVLAAGFLGDTLLISRKASSIQAQLAARYTAITGQAPATGNPARELMGKIALMKDETVLPGAEGHGRRVIDILRALSQNAPPGADLRLTRLTINPDGVQVDGETDAISVVDDFQGRLVARDIFGQVTILSTDIDSRTQKVRFRIKAAVAPAP
jgi:general secretion pathway protein L